MATEAGGNEKQLRLSCSEYLGRPSIHDGGKPVHRHNFWSATHKIGSKVKAGSMMKPFLTMVFLPWLLFLVVGALFIGIYYYFPFIAIFVLICIGFLSAMMLVSGRGQGNGGKVDAVDRKFLGMLFLLALGIGTCCGLRNYHDSIYFYWSAAAGRDYTNVAPDSLAEAHQDAGIMVFSDDAVVDKTKPIGFKAGSIYCVAPVIRFEATHASEIQYWAAGVDCCSRRGFYTCNDVGNKDAHSGMVIKHTDSIFSGLHMQHFKHAIKMASEVYGLTTVEDPILVRWVHDVEVTSNKFLSDGIWGLVEQGLWYLVVSVFLACVCMVINFSKEKAQEGKEELERERLINRQEGGFQHEGFQQ